MRPATSLEREGTVSDWQLYKRLLRYVAPYWYLFVFSIGGFLLYSFGNVMLADLMQFLLDSLNGRPAEEGGMVSRTAHRLAGETGQSALEFARVAVPLAAIAIAFTRAMGYFAGTYFMNHIARNLVHVLRRELFEKMLVAPSAYYDRQSQGVLVSKITFNVEQVTGAATRALKVVIGEGLTVLGLLGYMLYLNWRLCLVFLLVAPFIALVVSVVGKHFRRYSRRIQASMGDVTQVSGESIGGYREIRLFGGQRQQGERFEQASAYNRNQSLKLAFADALSTPVIQTMLAIALAALVWFALDPDILAGFTAGSLVAFLTAAGQLGKPIKQVSSVQSTIQRALAASEDIFAQLDMDEEIDRGQHVTARARGDLRIEHLSFAYPGGAEDVLSDINLEVRAGQTVALVGRSGSGKSTLIQLIARFYPLERGRILLDGVPIEEYRLENLRRQLAMVSQDPVLFNDSVLNNIAYGDLEGASREAVETACQSAHAMEFISQLPAGLDTRLGDDGGGLSGGQRQRLAIARAILKDAPLLILDEATSALDNESEHRIQRALETIMHNRTTIVIAHRLSTVEHADRIVVMDGGCIVAEGTHQQLLEQGGLYAQLYHQEFAS